MINNGQSRDQPARPRIEAKTFVVIGVKVTPMPVSSRRSPKLRPATWPGQVLQPGQTRLGVAAPPLADGVFTHAQFGGDLGMADAGCAGQHDLGAENVTMRGREGVSTGGEHSLVGCGHGDHERERHDHVPYLRSRRQPVRDRRAVSQGKIRHDDAMPTIPDSTKNSVTSRAAARARERWPKIEQVNVRFKRVASATSTRLSTAMS